jgi:hypothetical protein
MDDFVPVVRERSFECKLLLHRQTARDMLCCWKELQKERTLNEEQTHQMVASL